MCSVWEFELSAPRQQTVGLVVETYLPLIDKNPPG